MAEVMFPGGDEFEAHVISVSEQYFQESDNEKFERMRLNRLNFESFHHRADMSHKKAGQSKEFLPKQSLAVEQIVAFFEQGLIESGDWFNVETEPGIVEDAALLKSDDVRKILQQHLDKNNFVEFVSDSVKLGLLGSLMIAKVRGELVDNPSFKAETKEFPDGTFKRVLKKQFNNTWELKLDLIRQEDWYPDPTGNDVYEMQRIAMDLSQVQKMSVGKAAVYDPVIVKMLGPSEEDLEQKHLKSKETNQIKIPSAGFRRTVEIWEFWGDIIHPQTGLMLAENVTWTIANRRHLISKPKPNPFWHGKSPFVVSPLTRVPKSVWHRALMDAPTKNNTALNELYNLIVDGGMMATHGIKQIRPDWLEDPRQVAAGIPPGTTLSANSSMPPGAKVLERVDTSSLSSETIAIYSLMNSEFAASALSNDLRLGQTPARETKATAIVESSNTITTIFTGMAKIIESQYIEQILTKGYMNILQHIKDIDPPSLEAQLGKIRAQEVLAQPAEDIFAASAQGMKFKVYGVSRTLSKLKDFRKLTAFLQTLATNPLFVQEFLKRFSIGKLFGEIGRALDIATERIQPDSLDANPAEALPAAGVPNAQSQIPQASAGTDGTIESQIPRGDFPPSPAVEGR